MFQSQVEIIFLKYEGRGEGDKTYFVGFNLKLRLFSLSTLDKKTLEKQLDQLFQSQVEIIFLKYCHIWGLHDFPSEKSTI